MKNFSADLLEKALLEGLLADTRNVLKEWETNPFYESTEMAEQFWNRIKAAPQVAIVGDYDCDGICASYIMGRSIQEVCGKDKRLVIRIPHRFSEGYGINDKIRAELEEKLPKGSAIITVDNGIAAASVLEQFEKDGYVVLMTDHHELRPGCNVPNVTFAVDPAVPELSEGFSFKKWCGAAVAFKLCEQVVSEKLARELEVFAGLATVADCMDLKGGNWGLVRKAVNAFRSGRAPQSLSAILSEMKQGPLFANEDSFGYYLGPCFNASGRLVDDGASKVLSYLFAPSAEKLRTIVELNEQRRQIRDEEFDLIERKIEENGLAGNSPIWVNYPGLHEGIVGILAGKVAEKYRTPAIVTTTTETPGLLKGSARSYGNIDIFAYLSGMGELFEKMGGHPGAAGLSITEENFEKASKNQIKKSEGEEKDDSEWKIDADDIPFVENLLKNFRPFGEGNPAPLFTLDVNLKNGELQSCGRFPHLILKSESNGYKITHFNHYPNALTNEDEFEMTGYVSGSAFRGIETPTFNAEEVRDIENERED